VQCPYCNKVHGHGFGHVDDIDRYQNEVSRWSHCFPPVFQQYSFCFPFQQSPPLGFEINKDGKRFEAIGYKDFDVDGIDWEREESDPDAAMIIFDAGGSTAIDDEDDSVSDADPSREEFQSLCCQAKAEAVAEILRKDRGQKIGRCNKLGW